ncbi:MAG: TolC family protein [Bacteroidales bacterium]|jgi:outer membrane protein TolC
MKYTYITILFLISFTYNVFSQNNVNGNVDNNIDNNIDFTNITQVEKQDNDTTNDTINVYDLDDCINIAIENNADLRKAHLNVLSAQETKSIAFTKYFPNVSAFAFGSIFSKPFLDVDASNVDINISSPDANINNLIQTISNLYGNYLPDINLNMKMMPYFYINGATAVQPLYAGGRIVTGNKMANLGVEAAQLQKNASHNEIIKKVEDNFWFVISLQEKLKTVEFFRNMLDTLVNTVEVAYEAGLTTKTDLLKVKLKKNELNSNYIKLNNGINMARLALFQSIGLDNDNDAIFVSETDSIENIIQYQVNLEESVANRNEYKLLDINLNVEKLKRKMILGESLPQLAIGGGYLCYSFTEKPNINAMGFATLSIPISGWWETSHKLKQQDINIQIAETDKNNFTELLTLQVKQAWNELTESINQLEISNELIVESKENLKINKDYFDAGMLSLTEYLQAQGVLHQSLDQYVENYIEYRKKLSEYKRLTNQN